MTAPLSLEQSRNIETIRRLFACERRKDLEAWASLWAPSGRQTFPWLAGDADIVGLPALVAAATHKFATRSEVTIEDEVMAMADPHSVFATVKVSMRIADLDRRLDVALWARFIFDDAGRILEFQEVFDSGAIQRAVAAG